MRMLVTGDWHLGVDYGDVDRTPDIEAAARGIVSEARTAGVDAVVHLGDLFHAPDPHVRHVTLALEVLHALDEFCSVFVVAGNHDVYERRNDPCGLTAIMQAQFKRVIVVLDPYSMDILGVQALFLPYLPKVYAKVRGERPEDAMARAYMEACDAGAKVAFGHMTDIEGARTGSGDAYERGHGLLSRRVRWPEGMAGEKWLILNGHWHGAQSVKMGESTVLMPGSIERMGFGEAGDAKSYILYEV